ncbi:hypothetical protein NA56DRAFT_666783 [Hyaloscypha hepaticicola]|uniref:DDE-1 domain-containing protein n=1 Tax=Hyaloscypha hepaticicola TaxID=2082293 RepID=A0A2J6QPA5_9HELO|nr:hypothetical protein NA56DRAFT_666783 [Hyaloscypha hepaticicola]
MDKTKVILYNLGFIKVLVHKDNPRDYKGTGVKRTIVITIECICGNGKSLLLMIIWPATIYQRQVNQKPRVLIYDSFGIHEILEILEFCFENNIILYRLSSYISHKFQSCNIRVFIPLKVVYHERTERILSPCGLRVGYFRAI